MGPRAAELLHGHVLAGDRLDDVRSGDEHVGGAVDHDREVGDGGGVDVPAGAGAHDQADLRDDAARVHVPAEDLAVEPERDHALLDAGAGALVDADDRAAGLDREVHDLGDLLAVDLAQRAAEDREVLGEDAHLAAVDGAEAGDHAVAVGALLLQAERGGPVPGQLVELDERALVEELLDPLAGGLAALGVLLLDRLRRPGVHGLVEAALEVGELARGGVGVDVLGDVGAFPRLGRVLGSHGEQTNGHERCRRRPPSPGRRLACPTIRWRWSRRPARPTRSSPSGRRPVARRAWSSSPSTRPRGAAASTARG